MRRRKRRRRLLREEHFSLLVGHFPHYPRSVHSPLARCPSPKRLPHPHVQCATTLYFPETQLISRKFSLKTCLGSCVEGIICKLMFVVTQPLMKSYAAPPLFLCRSQEVSHFSLPSSPLRLPQPPDSSRQRASGFSLSLSMFSA